MGTMVSLRLCLHSTVALPILRGADNTCRAADFFVCGSRSGKGQDQSSWLQTTDYRLQTTALYEQ